MEETIAEVIRRLIPEVRTLRGLGPMISQEAQDQIDQADGRLVNAIKDLAQALKLEAVS